MRRLVAGARARWRYHSVIALCILSGCWISILLLSFSGKAVAVCGPGCIDKRLAEIQRPDGSVAPGRTQDAAELVRSQLRLSPFDPSGWLRLAALDLQTNGVLTRRGRYAVEASYRYSPVNAEVAGWRLLFVFDHWPQVSSESRSSALRELKSLAASAGNRRVLSEVGAAVSDPAGRLAFRFAAGPLS